MCIRDRYTVRFKIAPGQEIHVNDMIRGDVKVMSDILDDKVLYKSACLLYTSYLSVRSTLLLPLTNASSTMRNWQPSDSFYPVATLTIMLKLTSYMTVSYTHLG